MWRRLLLFFVLAAIRRGVSSITTSRDGRAYGASQPRIVAAIRLAQSQDVVIGISVPRPATTELAAMERAAVGSGRQAMQALRNAGLLRMRGGFSATQLPGTLHASTVSWSLQAALSGSANCSDSARDASWRIDLVRLIPSQQSGQQTPSSMKYATVGCAFAPPGSTAWVRVHAADLGPISPASVASCNAMAAADSTAVASQQSRNRTLFWAASSMAAAAPQGSEPSLPRWVCNAYLQLAIPSNVLAMSGDPLDAESTVQAGSDLASKQPSEQELPAGYVTSPAGSGFNVIRATVGAVIRLPWGEMDRDSEPFLGASSTPGGISQTPLSSSMGAEDTTTTVHVAGAASLRWRPAQGGGAVMAAASSSSTLLNDAVSFGSWPSSHCQSPIAGWIPTLPSSPGADKASPCLLGHSPLAGSTWPPLQSSPTIEGGLFAQTADSVALRTTASAGTSVTAVVSSDSSRILADPGSRGSAAVSWSLGSLPSRRGRVVTTVGASLEDTTARTAGAIGSHPAPAVLLSRALLPAGFTASALPVVSAYHVGERSSNCTVVVRVRVLLPGVEVGTVQAFELRQPSDWPRGSPSAMIARVHLASGYDSILDLGALPAALPTSGDDGRGGVRKISIIRLRRATSTGSFAVGDSEHETDAIGVLDSCEAGPAGIHVRGTGLRIEGNSSQTGSSWQSICSFNATGVHAARVAHLAVESDAATGAAVLQFGPHSADHALRVVDAEASIARDGPGVLLSDAGGVATIAPMIAPGSIASLMLRPAATAATGGIGIGVARSAELLIEASSRPSGSPGPAWRCRVSVAVLPPPPLQDTVARWSSLGGTSGGSAISSTLHEPERANTSTRHPAFVMAAFSSLHAGICTSVRGVPTSIARSFVRCASPGLCSSKYYLCTDGVPSALLDAAPSGLVCRNDTLVSAGSFTATIGAPTAPQMATTAGAAAITVASVEPLTLAECRAPERPTTGVSSESSDAARRGFCRVYPTGTYCTAQCSLFRVVCGEGDGTVAPALQTAPVGQSCLNGEWVTSTEAPCSRVRDAGCAGAPLSGTELRCAAFAEAETDKVSAPVPGTESTGLCSPLTFVCDQGKRLAIKAAPPGTKCSSWSRIPAGASVLTLSGSDAVDPAVSAVTSFVHQQTHNPAATTPLPVTSRLLLALSPGRIVPADDSSCYQSQVDDFSDLASLTCPESLSDSQLPTFTQLARLGPSVSSSVSASSTESQRLAATGAAIAPLLAAAFDTASNLRNQMRSDLALPVEQSHAWSSAELPQLWRCVGLPSRLCTAEASSCSSHRVPGSGSVQLSSVSSLPLRGPAGTACFGGELVPWDYDGCGSLADPVSGTVVDRYDPDAADTVSRKFVVLGIVLEGVPAAAGSSIGVQLSVRRAFGSLYTSLLSAAMVKRPGSSSSTSLVVGEQMIMLRHFDVAAVELKAAMQCPANGSRVVTAQQTVAPIATGLTVDQMRAAIPFRSLSAAPHAPWAVPLAPEQGTSSPAELGPEAWRTAPAGAGPAAMQVFLGADTSTAVDELASAISRDLANGMLQKRLQASAGLGPQLQRLHVWGGTGCEAVDVLDPSIPHSGPTPGSSLSLEGTLVLIDNPRHPASQFGGFFAWWFDIPQWGQVTIIVLAVLLVLAICGAIATCRRCCGIRCDNTPRRHKRRKPGASRHGVIRHRNTSDEDEGDGHGVPAGIRDRLKPQQVAVDPFQRQPSGHSGARRHHSHAQTGRESDSSDSRAGDIEPRPAGIRADTRVAVSRNAGSRNGGGTSRPGGARVGGRSSSPRAREGSSHRDGSSTPTGGHRRSRSGRSGAEWGSGRGPSGAVPDATPPTRRMARNPSYPSRRRVPLRTNGAQRAASSRHVVSGDRSAGSRHRAPLHQGAQQVAVRPTGQATRTRPAVGRDGAAYSSGDQVQRALAVPRMHPASWHPGSGMGPVGGEVPVNFAPARPSRPISQGTEADDPRAPSPA